MKEFTVVNSPYGSFIRCGCASREERLLCNKFLQSSNVEKLKSPQLVVVWLLTYSKVVVGTPKPKKTFEVDAFCQWLAYLRQLAWICLLWPWHKVHINLCFSSQ